MTSLDLAFVDIVQIRLLVRDHQESRTFVNAILAGLGAGVAIVFLVIVRASAEGASR